jgi:hypothetical protein
MSQKGHYAPVVANAKKRKDALRTWWLTCLPEKNRLSLVLRETQRPSTSTARTGPSASECLNLLKMNRNRNVAVSLGVVAKLTVGV